MDNSTTDTTNSQIAKRVISSANKSFTQLITSLLTPIILWVLWVHFATLPVIINNYLLAGTHPMVDYAGASYIVLGVQAVWFLYATILTVETVEALKEMD